MWFVYNSIINKKKREEEKLPVHVWEDDVLLWPTSPTPKPLEFFEKQKTRAIVVVVGK